MNAGTGTWDSETSGIPPTPDDSDVGDESPSVSLDTILPDDVLEKVLSYLPIVSIIRSGSVCRRWYDAVHRGRCSLTSLEPQKPWYFMFTLSDDPVTGFAYDPSLRKWYNFDFPCIMRSNCSASSSCGLVCLMDGENSSRIFVGNPITKVWRQLLDSPGDEYPHYSAPAMSVDRRSHSYVIAVVKCTQMPQEQEYNEWNFTIHTYQSKTKSWATPFSEVLDGWRGGGECVICNGILYSLIYSNGYLGNVEPRPRHRLVMYDLSLGSSNTPLMRMAIPAPCSLTCGRLMNHRDRLVMVGGIGRHDRPGIIRGIGIWELHEREWHQVARMPHKFIQGFGEFDDVFSSCGSEDLIYIQTFGSPVLLTFDMSLKLWRWSVKSPVTKRFSLQLFTGFCFEPRLEIAS